MPKVSSDRSSASADGSAFPGSEPLFKPYHDAARRSGEAVEFVQFYDGNVARIRAVPVGNGRLELMWEQLARLDS
jgi:hypothetical protein